MGLLETISSVLGAGTGGTVLAAALYAGAITLEKEMRDEAKSEIADFINRTNALPDGQVIANFTNHAFRMIFGARHWTLNCITRSFLASLVICFTIIGLFWLKYPENIEYALRKMTTGAGLILLLMLVVILCCIPDYLSLFKGRIILERMTRSTTIRRTALLVALDLLLSILISVMALVVIDCFARPDHSVREAAVEVDEAIRSGFGLIVGGTPLHKDDVMVVVFLLSTMMTSVWAVLILLSSLILKTIASAALLMRFVRWMFDVEAHPVRVLGLVSAAIVWVGSVVYAVL